MTWVTLIKIYIYIRVGKYCNGAHCHTLLMYASKTKEIAKSIRLKNSRN